MSWWTRGGARIYRTPSWRRTRRQDVHSRRMFLRGAAASLALPFLPSALPRSAWANGGQSPVRLVFFYVPNGIQMEWWTPEAEGAGYDLPSILEPLAPIQDKVLVLSGLSNEAAIVPVAGDHARGTGSFLTCRTVVKTSGADISNGVSVDQVAAQALGEQTLFPSLQLGMEGGSSVGSCDSGYSCAYQRNISWSGPATPLPKMTDPRLVFSRLFEGAEAGLTPEEVERRKLLRLSVLDSVLQEANALHATMGRSDQRKLDEYMTGVRELEVRLEQQDDASCLAPAEPTPGLPYADALDTMNELMAVALQCDLTRVATFMLGNGSSGRDFSAVLGSQVAGAHHQLSHHQNNAERLEKLRQIGQWEVGQFAALAQRLDAMDEGGCSVLDRSLLYFSSECADGDSHSHRNLPVLLAGGGDGLVDSGRHVVYPSNTPMADLFLAMLERFGVFEPSFGQDSTGPLAGLS